MLVGSKYRDQVLVLAASIWNGSVLSYPAESNFDEKLDLLEHVVVCNISLEFLGKKSMKTISIRFDTSIYVSRNGFFRNYQLNHIETW